MPRALAARAGLAARDLGVRVDLDPVLRGLVARADPADQDLAVRGLVARADPAVQHPVALAGPADIRDLAGRLDLHPVGRVDPAARVDLDPVVRLGLGPAARVDPADIRDRAGPAGLDLPGRAAPVALAGPADIRDLADLAARDLPDQADQADPAVLADPVVLGDRRQRTDRVALADRLRRRMCPGVLTTALAPTWVAPGMRRTASARPATVRRPRLHNTAGAGTTGLRPEGRRRTGTDRRLQVDGTVLRLPVVGTAHGTGRRAI